MASLKDRTGYSDGSQGSHEFLPGGLDRIVGLRGRLAPSPRGGPGGCVRALRDISCGDPRSLTNCDARGRGPLRKLLLRAAKPYFALATERRLGADSGRSRGDSR
jgi:hypothetical protein